MSWKYIKESQNFIYTIMGIFVFFALIGFLFPVPPEIMEKILEYIQNLIEQTEGMSGWELIRFIFLNNFQSSFFGLVLGIVFGVFPILVAVANGYLVGFVASLAISENGFLILWRLLPHGIFELPAVFISLGLGLKFGSFIFQKQKKKAFFYYLVEGLRVFLFVIVPLLIIAAVIEGTLIAFFG